MELQHLDDALAIRAAYLINDVTSKLNNSKADKKTTLNDLYAQEIFNMAKSHMLYMSFAIYREVIETTEFSDSRVKPLLQLIARIFALKQLMQDNQACYETGYFGKGTKELLNESMKVSLKELRPHMIPLVELNTDELLDMSHLSAIGNKYGDIYEA